MIHRCYQHGHFPELAERRLLWKVPAPEVLPEQKILDQLKEKDITEAQQIIEAAPVEKRETILHNVGILLDNLRPDEQQQIRNNLTLLRERVTTKQPETKTEPSAEQKRESMWDPKSWSVMTKLKAGGIAAGATAVLGIAGYVGYNFIQWLRGKANQTKEVAKKGISWITKTLLIGGALALGGTLTYIGALKVGDWMKQVALDEATKKLNEVAEKIKTASAEQLVKFQKEKEEWENKIVSIKKELGQKIEEKTEKPKEKTAKPEPKPEEVAEKEQKKKETVAAAKEAAKKSAEIGIESFAGRYLARFEDHPDIQWPEGETAKEHQTEIISILDRFMGDKDLTMEKIFGCMKFGAIDQEVLSKIYSPPVGKENASYQGYMGSADLIVRACFKHRKGIEKTYGGSVDKLTMKQFMEKIGTQNKAIVTLQEQIKDKGLKDLKDVDFKKVSEALGMDMAIAKDIIEMIKRHEFYTQLTNADVEGKLKNFSLNSALEMINALGINPEISVSEVRRKMEALNARKETLTNEERIALMLIEGVLTNLPKAEQLQPFFHNIFPNDAWVVPKDGEAISKENKATIEKYVNDKMSFHEAARLFLYKKMIEHENPTGVALLQADILRFIRKEEPGLIVDRLKIRAYRAGDNMVERILDKTFMAELQMSFNISDQMEERIVKTLHDLAPEAFDTGLKTFLDSFGLPIEPILAEAMEHKVPAGLVLAYLARKPIIGILDFRIARNNPTQLTNLINARSHINVRNQVATALKLRISPQIYHDAHVGLNTLVTNITKLKAVDPKLAARLEEGLTDCIRSGATEKHFHELNDLIQAEMRVGSIHPNANSILGELSRDSTDFLTKSTSARAREAIRVTSHPFRGRIMSHGVPIVMEVIGAYAALKNDIPAYYHYRNEEREAREEGKGELADVLALQKNKKLYVDLPFDAGSGLAYYLLQKRIANMALARTGSLGLAGAPSTAPIGAGGPLVVTLAIELVFLEIQHILDSIEENMRDINVTEKDAKNMPKAELERKLTDYAPGERPWGQWWRYQSLSREINGDTWEVLENESNTIRENHMDGYLFHRMLQKARAGDPFAMTLAYRMFNADGTEKQGGEVIMRQYIARCKYYLEQNYGTRNDLKKITQKTGLERALNEADLAASFQMDVAAAKGAIIRSEALTEQAQMLGAEIVLINQRIGASGTGENVEPLVKERDAKEAELEKLNEEYLDTLVTLESFEEFKLKQVDGTEKSIFDIANADDPLKSELDMKTEVKPQLASYRAAKSAIIKEITDPKKDYQEFTKRAKEIYSEIEFVNRLGPEGGIFSYRAVHYDHILEYGYMLDRYPDFDADGKLRELIWNLPSLYWNQMPGQHPYEKKFDAARDAIKANIAYTEQLKFKYFSASAEKDPEWHGRYIVGQENAMDRHSSSIIVTMTDGQILELKGTEGKEKKFATPVGVFICKPNETAYGEKNEFSWYVEPRYEGKFHIHANNALGIQQPGEWKRTETMRDIDLTLNDNKFFYPFPNHSLTLKLTLRNGTIVNWVIRDVNKARLEYLTCRYAKLEQAPWFEWHEGKFKRSVRKGVRGYLLENIDRQAIAIIEMSSEGAVLPGQKTILRIPKPPTQRLAQNKPELPQ